VLVCFRCIPVIFMPNDDVWQKYWATLWSMSMKKDMAIMINGYDLVDGKISLYETLTSISAERVREMQKSISNNYHKLHYSNIDYPGDAMERLLHILKAFGAKREKPHVCRDLIKEPYGILPFTRTNAPSNDGSCQKAKCAANQRVAVVSASNQNVQDGNNPTTNVTTPYSVFCLKTCGVCSSDW